MSERMNRQSGHRPASTAEPSRRPAIAATADLAGEAALEAFPIGMTYTPMQRWREPYCAQKALERGTLFPPLDLPFAGRRC